MPSRRSRPAWRATSRMVTAFLANDPSPCNRFHGTGYKTVPVTSRGGREPADHSLATNLAPIVVH